MKVDKQYKYLNDNKLLLWARQDTDKALIDLQTTPEAEARFKAREKHLMAEVLMEEILNRWDRYDKVYDVINTEHDTPFNAERHNINMYVLSQKEMEELLEIE